MKQKMKDNEKLVLGIIVAIAILGVVYFVFLVAPGPAVTTTTQKPYQPPQTTPTEPVTGPTQPPATNAPPTTVDAKALEQQFKSSIENSDTSGCDKIENALLREVCLREIYVKSGDKGKCATLKEYQQADLCYFMIGRNLKDKSVCESIQAEKTREACVIQAGG